jgi:bifunctional non-homologous end joining protein LigD
MVFAPVSSSLRRAAKSPPAGPGWIHEIKHDGFRIIARRSARGVRLVTRNGNDFSVRFPNVAAAVNALPVRSCLIDGEAIVTGDRGLAVFEMIRNRRHEAGTVLCAFNLIELDGEDLRRALLELRKARLRGLLQQGHPGIAFNTHYIVDGAIVFKNACALGCEGIVSKRLGSPYRSGRSAHCLKVKGTTQPVF